MILKTCAKNVENSLNQGISYVNVSSAPTFVNFVLTSLNRSLTFHRNKLHKHLGETGHALVKSR